MELSALVDRVVNLPPGWIYTVLFLGSIVESLFPLYPSDVITLYCAFLAGRGALSPWMVYGLAVAGSYVGVMAVYGVGLAMARGWLKRHRVFFFTEDRLGEVERWFASYGEGALLVSRFLPGVRALVAPAAGLVQLGSVKVGLFALCSVVLWNGFLMALGLLAGANWERARGLLAGYNASVLTLLILLALGWGALLLYRKARS
jgi:membrane-associated protein